MKLQQFLYVVKERTSKNKNGAKSSITFINYKPLFSIMKYDLELNKAIEKIKQENAKLVCIQLPDGIKPKAQEICDTLQKETGATTLIWQGSCYGACDWPLGIDKLGVDLLIAWGHSVWKHDTFEGIAVDE